MRKRPCHVSDGRLLGAAARIASAGSRVIGVLTGLLVLIMMLYGGYSLWDMAMTYAGAFPDEDLLALKPTVTDDGSSPTFAELMEINEDVVAWITIDGTGIDYPVLQGESNLEYVNKNVYGNFSLSGAIFMDCTCDPWLADSCTLLYGHNVTGGAMFGSVVRFLEEEYFEEHPTGTILLPDAACEITLFAVVETDASDTAVYVPSSWDSETLGELLEYIESLAVQQRSIDIDAEDHIIGLSTCAEAVTNGRVVLYGRLDPIQGGSQ